ncbi:ankyrin, partial [Neurospora tetrasperma FGSC 2509]
TALMLASMNGFTTIVRLLLTKEELDINAKHHVTGNSALHLASRGGSIKTVRLLLEHHADPLMENSSGFLPLHLAIAQGHSEVASFLV